MDDKKKDRKDELDQFWDIKKLIPQKSKSGANASPVSRPIPKIVPVSAPSNRTSANIGSDNKLTDLSPTYPRKSNRSNPIYAQYEQFSPFLKKVTVLNWKSPYGYYDFFRSQALNIQKLRGQRFPEPDFPPFFSYVPQYSQLNKRQFSWYLWWRECVRNNIFLSTDISYISLLAFEIINLGAAINVRRGLSVLLALWSNYSKRYPQLSSTLAEWICDYSLIHGIPIPLNELNNKSIIDFVTLPETFFNVEKDNAKLFSKLLLSCCNSYNYRKSKFYTEDHRPLYDKHIPVVIGSLLSQGGLIDVLSRQSMKKVSRMAFTGAICVCQERKEIHVEYIPITESLEVRSLIGNSVKYAENKLRTYLGVRSKLGVRDLPGEIMTAIDRYFDETLGQPLSEQSPEYEKLYDVPNESFSIEKAKDIEKHSWAVTERLVEAFAEETEAVPVQEETRQADLTEISEPSASENNVEEFLTRIAKYQVFFQCVREQDLKGQLAFIKEHRVLPDAMIDEINECAVEFFGDILLEEAESGYQIIEEYRSLFA